MKIYLDTVGCRLNQSEIEAYAQQFRTGGHELVADPAQADLTVINTCTVTAAAAADSRKKIRAMSRAGTAQVVVTGCWSTLEPRAAGNLPGVNLVIPNETKDELVQTVLDLSMEDLDPGPLAREPIPGPRSRTRAFIKVQDGCDNRCTFCITTLARGPGRSRSIPEIIQYIHAALAGGCKEIVLTGVHLGSWGSDLTPAGRLYDLVKVILADTDTPRIRLSSLEPWDLDEDFFKLWEDSRLANHIHLPLQSGSRATLKRMARKTNPESYARLISFARNSIANVAITTDIIAGFPGETEEEFKQSLSFIEKMGFARGHVFTYSERQGTAAARMSNQIPYPVRKERNDQIRQVLARSEIAFQERSLGDVRPVLWEKANPNSNGNWTMSGFTDNYLRVSTIVKQPLNNQICMVKLTGWDNRGLVGDIIEQS